MQHVKLVCPCCNSEFYSKSLTREIHLEERGLTQDEGRYKVLCGDCITLYYASDLV